MCMYHKNALSLKTFTGLLSTQHTQEREGCSEALIPWPANKAVAMADVIAFSPKHNKICHRIFNFPAFPPNLSPNRDADNNKVPTTDFGTSSCVLSPIKSRGRKNGQQTQEDREKGSAT